MDGVLSIRQSMPGFIIRKSVDLNYAEDLGSIVPKESKQRYAEAFGEIKLSSKGERSLMIPRTQIAIKLNRIAEHEIAKSSNYPYMPWDDLKSEADGRRFRRWQWDNSTARDFGSP